MKKYRIIHIPSNFCIKVKKYEALVLTQYHCIFLREYHSNTNEVPMKLCHVYHCEHCPFNKEYFYKHPEEFDIQEI